MASPKIIFIILGTLSLISAKSLNLGDQALLEENIGDNDDEFAKNPMESTGPLEEKAKDDKQVDIEGESSYDPFLSSSVEDFVSKEQTHPGDDLIHNEDNKPIILDEDDQVDDSEERPYPGHYGGEHSNSRGDEEVEDFETEREPGPLEKLVDDNEDHDVYSNESPKVHDDDDDDSDEYKYDGEEVEEDESEENSEETYDYDEYSWIDYEKEPESEDVQGSKPVPESEAVQESKPVQESEPVPEPEPKENVKEDNKDVEDNENPEESGYDDEEYNSIDEPELED